MRDAFFFLTAGPMVLVRVAVYHWTRANTLSPGLDSGIDKSFSSLLDTTYRLICLDSSPISFLSHFQNNTLYILRTSECRCNACRERTHAPIRRVYWVIDVLGAGTSSSSRGAAIHAPLFEHVESAMGSLCPARNGTYTTGSGAAMRDMYGCIHAL